MQRFDGRKVIITGTETRVDGGAHARQKQSFATLASTSTPWSRRSGSPALRTALTSISPLAPQTEHSQT
jgi:hypothetical protein